MGSRAVAYLAWASPPARLVASKPRLPHGVMGDPRTMTSDAGLVYKVLLPAFPAGSVRARAPTMRAPRLLFSAKRENGRRLILLLFLFVGGFIFIRRSATGGTENN